MTWKEIMSIKDPNKALLEIENKVHLENLSLEEMEDMMEMYAEMHNTTTEQMAYYPNGENVISGPLQK